MFTEPTLGNITIFAGNFAPRSWAFCNGALLPISQNEALFAIIGTTYGGDGQTTFGLPDLRGRFAVGTGQAPGLSNYILGQMAGTESVTVLTQQLGAHSHPFSAATGNPTANSSAGTVDDPTGAVPAVVPAGSAYNTASSGSTMGTMACTATTAPAGNTQPIDIMSPYLVMNYIIAVEGIFPSRN